MRRPLPFFVMALLCPVAYAQTPPAAACTERPAPAVSEADKAFAAGNFAQAESLYAAMAPGTAASYAGLVNAQMEQDKVTEATASAQKAAAAMPSSADAQALVALTLMRAGEIGKTSPVLTKAFALDHCSAETLFALAKFNELLARHLSAAHELASAHVVAPWDASITAAWVLSLPTGPTPNDDTRTPTLHAFLASKPALPPAVLDRLRTQLAMLEQHLNCAATDAAKAPVTVTLEGLMLTGTRARSYGLRAKLNRVDLPLLELDSSVSGIVLNPADAKKAGVHPLEGARAPQEGIYYAVADHVSIGGVEYQNCTVRVAPAAALANANSLIGTDFFRDHLIKIDYVNRRLTLTPYPDSPAGPTNATEPPTERAWTGVFLAGSDIFVPTLLNGKGPILMLLDTGSLSTIFSPSINKSILMSMADKDSNIHGFSGTIVKTLPRLGGSGYNDSNPQVLNPDGKLLPVTLPVKTPTLRFANSDFQEQHSHAFDLTPKSHEAGIEIGGLLGFTVLREYYIDIDYRNALVNLQYDLQHLYITRELQRGN